MSVIAALAKPTTWCLLAGVSGGRWQIGLRALFPALAYLAIGPVLWWFFGRTWRELDVAAHHHQRRVLAEGRQDLRPPVLFAITALMLTLQQYYGQLDFYEEHLKPWLREFELLGLAATDWRRVGRFVNVPQYGELYGYAWWSFSRVAGYVALPLACWKLFFRSDSLLDMGLRFRGLKRHAWIYALCLAIVLPAVYVVSRAPDFAAYYPFYKHASRSWFDLVCWELLYGSQFFALEIFFRGFWLSALRNALGSARSLRCACPTA